MIIKKTSLEIKMFFFAYHKKQCIFTKPNEDKRQCRGATHNVVWRLTRLKSSLYKKTLDT